ncbi:MAG: electron transfer flavoprotein subunit beta/FixA family protein [Gracilibacteraceae bacterium]|jgi:electron transfer flavoprotein beta subunit|nr:electron transfer flavoprotein subunit beta/FixA family protein [Gracilibacteraceae bacterium]
MRFIVCYKWTLDEEDIRVDRETRALALDHVRQRISPYDRNAIECGVRLAEEQGGEAVALSVGGPEVADSLKDALSRGPAHAVWVGCPELSGADAAAVAKTLAAAVRHIGEYDLLICGEGSSDYYNQQTGPRLAALLGIPAVTSVSGLTLSGRVLRAERKLEEGLEIVETDLPALVTVLPDIGEARIPNLKQILAAGKKPVVRLTPAELGLGPEALEPRARRESLLGTVADRKRIVLRGEGAVAELLTKLRAEGRC